MEPVERSKMSCFRLNSSAIYMVVYNSINANIGKYL